MHDPAVRVPISQALTVLSAAGYPLTPRQLKYLWPASSERQGWRFYSTTDLAVAGLYCDLLALCRKLELPIWSARAALRYREDDVRRAIERRQPRWLVVDPFLGTCELSETCDVRDYAIDLRAVRGRIVAAFAARDSMEPSTGGYQPDPAWVLT